jgi:hypothetical protein
MLSGRRTYMSQEKRPAKCSLLRGYGTSGVINLVKTHLDMVGYARAQVKKDKQSRKNSLLLAFFEERTAPIAKLLKPTVKAPSPRSGSGS